MSDKVLQNLDSMRELIGKIECSLGMIRLVFIVDEYNGAPYLQIFFRAPDAETGKMEDQWCRKFTLQYTMCDTEVVRTAYKAAEAAYIHELQEAFRFMDMPIYNPHTDIYKLVELRMQPDVDDTRIPQGDKKTMGV